MAASQRGETPSPPGDLPSLARAVRSVEYFSSAEGVPLHKDHEYEMVSIYENTSGEEQDSMAVMYMYLLDKRFEKPDLERAAKLVAEASPPESSSEGM